MAQHCQSLGRTTNAIQVFRICSGSVVLEDKWKLRAPDAPTLSHPLIGAIFPALQRGRANWGLDS
jgi:hypothetical protein